MERQTLYINVHDQPQQEVVRVGAQLTDQQILEYEQYKPGNISLLFTSSWICGLLGLIDGKNAKRWCRIGLYSFLAGIAIGALESHVCWPLLHSLAWAVELPSGYCRDKNEIRHVEGMLCNLQSSVMLVGRYCYRWKSCYMYIYTCI